MFSIWGKISLLGTRNLVDFEVKKKIKLANQVNAVLILTGAIYSTLFLLFQQLTLAVIGYGVVLCLLSGVYFFYTEKILLARLIIIIVTNLAVFLYSYMMGISASIHNFFFAIVTLPWAIFRREEKQYLCFSVGLSIFLWTIIYFFHDVIAFTIVIPNNVLAVFHFLTGVMTFLILLTTMLFNFSSNEFFKVKSQIAIKRLRKKYEELEQKQKIEKELLLMARKVQLQMLPSVALQLSGYRVCQYYQAAHIVGGDFLDYFALSEQKMVILVADIVGKGVPASLMTQALKTVMDITFKNKPDTITPAILMAELNHLFNGHTTIYPYVPMLLGILDNTTNTFTYSNAGHEPGLVMRADGSIEELTLGGSPLGMNFAVSPEDVETYEEGVVSLHPNDKLILITDGFTDLVSANGERFDYLQFHELIQKHASKTSQNFITAIVDDCNAFQDPNNQADDMTMILVERGAV